MGCGEAKVKGYIFAEALGTAVASSRRFIARSSDDPEIARGLAIRREAPGCTDGATQVIAAQPDH